MQGTIQWKQRIQRLYYIQLLQYDHRFSPVQMCDVTKIYH